MGQYTIKDIEARAEALKNDVDNIYRALNDKLGSSPETLDQVPEYIMSIPDLPTEEPLTITPTIDGQEISALDDLKYNPITVEPVTSSIDSNIQPENIKEGVSILGVAGTLSGGSGVFVAPNGTKFRGSTFTEIPQLDTSNLTDMSKMFYECVNLISIPQLATSNVTNMKEMFYYCENLVEIPLLDTANVTDMSSMFANCDKLAAIPLLNTANVINMNYTFSGCSKLTTIPQLDTSKVTNMGRMFYRCLALTAIPRLDTSKVTNMESMFYYCDSLTTIPQLDTSKVTDMSRMFYYCRALTAIPRLDTSKVTNMESMFYYCDSLTTVEGIDFSGLTSNLTGLFGNYSPMKNLTRFIVNGKINVSISDNYSIKALTAIDYDSVKSILAAADRTDNTNAKTLAFNRTMTDQNGELAALVASCTSKGWTISGLTLQ